MQLSNTVVWGFDSSLQRSGSPSCTADLVARRSYYASARGTGDGTLDTATGNVVGADPGFADPVGSGQIPIPNFAPRFDSPLVDAADPASPVVDDLRGLARPVDGDGVGGARADIGAFEYPRTPPFARIEAPVEATAGQPVTVDAGTSRDPDVGEAVTYAWDFGDGTTATGETAQHAYAGAGVRQVTLTVTDPTGLTATATAQIQVAAAPDGGGVGGVDPGQPPFDPGQPPVDPGQPPVDPGQPPVDPGQPPVGPGQPPTRPGTRPDEPSARDAVAPRLSAVRIARRVRLATDLPRIAARRSSIGFALSEPARVTLRFARIGPRGRRSPVRTPIALAAPAGTVHAVFRGRLATGKALKPGRYRVTIVATDAAGNRSAARTATLTVLAGRR